jgi:hypothetical protein
VPTCPRARVPQAQLEALKCATAGLQSITHGTVAVGATIAAASARISATRAVIRRFAAARATVRASAANTTSASASAAAAATSAAQHSQSAAAAGSSAAAGVLAGWDTAVLDSDRGHCHLVWGDDPPSCHACLPSPGEETQVPASRRPHAPAPPTQRQQQQQLAAAIAAMGTVPGEGRRQAARSELGAAAWTEERDSGMLPAGEALHVPHPGPAPFPRCRADGPLFPSVGALALSTS